jgi:4-aminobutyrate aminotransferase-like enzyme/Ser/Thr protein kinase RdoA (MazF antagonist)
LSRTSKPLSTSVGRTNSDYNPANSVASEAAVIGSTATLKAASHLLQVPAPKIDADRAPEIAAEYFGVVARAHALSSERDCNFLLDTGTEQLLLKIANEAEDPTAIEAQTAVLEHIASRDPELPVPGVRRTKSGDWSAQMGPHKVRLLDFLPGTALSSVPRSASQRQSIGALLARLDSALSDFVHPGAERAILWDLSRAIELAPLLPSIEDPAQRARATRYLDDFAKHALPVLPRLRAQTIHNDFNPHNLLVAADDPHRISGIIDFGDMVRGPLINDLAVAAAYHVSEDGHPLAQVLDVVKAYHAINPLTAEELDVLFDLILTRQVITVIITAWRATLHPHNAAYILRNAPTAWRGLDRIGAVNRAEAQKMLHDACAAPSIGSQSSGRMANAFDANAAGKLSTADRSLIERRQKLLGPAYRLFYEEPLHFVRGEDVWLIDSTGNRYLDAYNNVVSVGHCHPHVVEAISKQTATLVTHTRYLHEDILDYAERLLATFPSALGHLMLTCTGSEANDLALRIAKASTGNAGIICTDTAYHGVTSIVAEISPSLGPYVPRGPHVRTVGGLFDGGFTAAVKNAVEDLAANGMGVAALICDTIFSSDGVVPGPKGFLKEAVDAVQAAGGLFIADEVQAGFARTGEAMWGFQRHGLTPDIVTMGKPMGNGYPVAGVALRPALVAEFGQRARYFNTFGGNPVAVAAANAVLDVIERQQLQQNSLAMGSRLLSGIEKLRNRFPSIGATRGAGLFIGVDVVDAHGKPDSALATRLVNAMRRRRVLISSTGREAQALKIRPPLTFTESHVQHFLGALEESLADPWLTPG